MNKNTKQSNTPVYVNCLYCGQLVLEQADKCDSCGRCLRCSE